MFQARSVSAQPVASGLAQINASGQAVLTAISTGAANTMTGTCTSGTQVGGTWAWKGSTVTCTAGQTLIIAITTGGANGQACYINDLTTPATVINQTATGGNSATWTFPSSGASESPFFNGTASATEVNMTVSRRRILAGAASMAVLPIRAPAGRNGSPW